MIGATPLKRERLIRAFAVVGIVVLCLLAMLTVENMLLAFVLGFVINYLFSPFVNGIERNGIPRKKGVSFLFLTTGFLIALAAYMLMPKVGEQILLLKNEFPKYSKGIADLVGSFEQSLNRIFPEVYKVDLSKSAEAMLSSASKGIFDGLPSFISTSVSVMLLAPLLAFFMLVDGQKAVKKLLEIVPNNFFEPALNLQYQINAQIGGFVRARLLEATIVGAVVWIGLIIIDFPHSLFFAVFAGLTNLIPYIGPVIGAVPALLVALVNGMGGMDVLGLAGVFVFAQLVDNVFIVPMVVAKIVNLHAVIVMVVIILGAQVGGVIGMIISIPVASIIKLTVSTIYQHMTEFRQ